MWLRFTTILFRFRVSPARHTRSTNACCRSSEPITPACAGWPRARRRIQQVRAAQRAGAQRLRALAPPDLVGPSSLVCFEGRRGSRGALSYPLLPHQYPTRSPRVDHPKLYARKQIKPARRPGFGDSSVPLTDSVSQLNRETTRSVCGWGSGEP